MKEIILGLNENENTVTFASIDDNNTILRLSTYDLIGKEESYDENTYLRNSGFGFSDVHGQEFKNGQKLPKNFKPKVGKHMLKTIEEAYHDDGSYCSKCSLFHVTEQYHDVSFSITDDGELYCKGCIEVEDLLRPLESADDLFKSKDMTGIKIPKEFQEVETLFCDSSGFGSDSERALTKQGASAAIKRILNENKKSELFCGLTGIGQFQVYVTIYAKKAKRKAA